MTALLERGIFVGGDQTDDQAEQLGTELPALDADPVPGKRTRRRPRAAASSSAPKQAAGRQPRAGGKFKSRAQIQQSMHEELEMYARMLALTWSMSDEHCADVLNETSANITRDMAALLARSDWVVERFEATTLLADVMKLINSALPLLRAVFVHHVARRGDQDEPEGGAERATSTVDYGQPAGYAPFRPAYTG